MSDCAFNSPDFLAGLVGLVGAALVIIGIIAIGLWMFSQALRDVTGLSDDGEDWP